MRRRSLILGPLFALALAGCKTANVRSPESASVASPPVVSKAANPEPTPPPPPPAALSVARSVSPEARVLPDTRDYPTLDDMSGTIPPANLPRPLPGCPVDPVLNVLAGSRDPQQRQDALNTVALMLATGTARALRHGSGGGGHSRSHNVGSGIDEVLQTDDDQSSVSKQVRPPVLFTLGWKF